MPGVCPACQKDIKWLYPPFCPGCGRPFPGGPTPHLCPDCLKQRFFFDGGRAAVIYQGPIAEAIQRFKYQGDLRLADPLGWLWGKVNLEGLSFEAIVPVPLHPRRLRKRGFNQALLLGRILGDRLGVQVLPRALERIRNTRPQVELDLAERQKNVRGAFAVSQAGKIEDKRLLLVDDVFTTGATVNECARVLKKSGAGEVFVLTLARVGGE